MHNRQKPVKIFLEHVL